ENTTDCIQHKVYENLVLISSKAKKDQIRALIGQGIIKSSNLKNSNRYVNDCTIKMLNAILLAGETEGQEHPSSHLNPFSKNVKDFVRTDLRGLGNVTKNNAYYKVIEILEKN
ncbi:hypothetical protein RYX36_035537, partial [Vicia faba]